MTPHDFETYLKNWDKFAEYLREGLSYDESYHKVFNRMSPDEIIEKKIIGTIESDSDGECSEDCFAEPNQNS